LVAAEGGRPAASPRGSKFGGLRTNQDFFCARAGAGPIKQSAPDGAHTGK